jgi:hypothetical protein
MGLARGLFGLRSRRNAAGGISAAVHAAIRAAPAAAGGTVMAASIGAAPAAWAAALCDFANAGPALGYRGEHQRCCGHNKTADAEVGHIPDPLILNRRPVCNRICERAFRSMVPKLIARDPWNDSAAACKARVAMRGLR